MFNWSKLMTHSLRKIEQNENNQVVSFPTGIDLWDKNGGIRSQEISLLVANKHSGSTSMALQIALLNVDEGTPVLYASSDISPELFMYKIMLQRAKEVIPSFHEVTNDVLYWDSLCLKYLEDLHAKPLYFQEFKEPELHYAMEGILKFRDKHPKGLIIVDKITYNYNEGKLSPELMKMFMGGIKNEMLGKERGALIVASTTCDMIDYSYGKFPSLLSVFNWNLMEHFVNRVLMVRKDINAWMKNDYFRPDFLFASGVAITADARVRDEEELVYYHSTHSQFYNKSNPVVKPLDEDDAPF
ncbi:MAG: hypothetical protein RLZZ71_508 [Bacteroidota bacterium]|jgi:hypothetical protein